MLDDLEKTFKGKHKDKPPSREEVQQYNQERERVKEVAKANPDDAYAQISDQLGAFFDTMDKIEELFHQEEEAARQVYAGDVSVKRKALQRVMIKSRLEAMHTEMRETMVYHTPPELGNLWTRFEQMREQIGKEQEKARAEQRRKNAQAAWQRAQRLETIRERALDMVAVALVIFYVWGLLWSISLHRENLKGFLLS